MVEAPSNLPRLLTPCEAPGIAQNVYATIRNVFLSYAFVGQMFITITIRWKSNVSSSVGK